MVVVLLIIYSVSETCLKILDDGFITNDIFCSTDMFEDDDIVDDGCITNDIFCSTDMFENDNIVDEGCEFPFTWEETGETYNSCVGEDNPWCASGSQGNVVPADNKNDYVRFCLGEKPVYQNEYT